MASRGVGDTTALLNAAAGAPMGGEPAIDLTSEGCCKKVWTAFGHCFAPLTYCLCAPVQCLFGCCFTGCFSDVKKDGAAIDYGKYEGELPVHPEIAAGHTEGSGVTRGAAGAAAASTEDAEVSEEIRSGLLFGSHTLSNRLVKAGITDGLCTKWGVPTEQMASLYTRYGGGGFGLVITGDTSVDDRCRIAAPVGHTPIIGGDGTGEAYRAIATNIKANGSKAVLQLTHPGPVVPFSDRAYAPSSMIADTPRGGKAQYAYALNDGDIRRIYNMFTAAAQEAERVGFDGIQLVASASYLPALFLSRHRNKHTGEWEGPAFVTRLLREMLTRRESDRFTIGVKVNSSDLQKGGYSSLEAAALVGEIARTGVEFVEISGGNCENIVLPGANPEAPREKYFLDFARRVLDDGSITLPVLATGDWRDRGLMNRAVQKYPNLLIGLGRPACIDPDVGRKLTSGEVGKIPNWFEEYMPPFVREKLETGSEDGRKMAYGIEVSWHAIAASSMATGEAVPRVVGIFDNPVNALAIKVGMYFKGVVPRTLLGCGFDSNPMI